MSSNMNTQEEPASSGGGQENKKLLDNPETNFILEN